MKDFDGGLKIEAANNDGDDDDDVDDKVEVTMATKSQCLLESFNMYKTDLNFLVTT